MNVYLEGRASRVKIKVLKSDQDLIPPEDLKGRVVSRKQIVALSLCLIAIQQQKPSESSLCLSHLKREQADHKHSPGLSGAGFQDKASSSGKAKEPVVSPT